MESLRKMWCAQPQLFFKRNIKRIQNEVTYFLIKIWYQNRPMLPNLKRNATIFGQNSPEYDFQVRGVSREGHVVAQVTPEM